MISKFRNYTNRIISVLTAVVMAVLSMSFPVGGASAAESFTNEELKEKANQIAFMVNEARIEAGLRPVYVIPYLNDVAQVRAREAIFSFSHTRADGSSFGSVIDTNLIKYSVVYENLAAGGIGKPEDTFEQWHNSPNHWKAIMNEKITHIGVGCAYEPNDPNKFVWYWQITFVVMREGVDNQYLPTEHAIEPKCEGDVNGDSVVDTYDYLYILDYLRKENEGYPAYLNEAQAQAADCYIDGLLTRSDAVIMMEYMLGDVKKMPMTMEEYTQHKAMRLLEEMMQS